MKTLFSFLLAAVTCVTIASISRATTYHVPADGSEIDTVIALTTTGDVVSVTEVRSYAPFTVNKAITVRNDTGSIQSITASTGLAVSLEGGTTAVVEGFRFVGGTGYAIATGLNGEFKNCTFVDNGNGYSTGAVQLSGSSKLTDCTITLTATTYPRAAVLSGAGSKLLNCTITTPYVSANGDLPVVEMDGADTEVSGCTISLLDSTSAAIVIQADGSGAVVLNNTIRATLDGIVAGSGVSAVSGNFMQIRGSGIGIRAGSTGSTVFENNTILSPTCDAAAGLFLIGTTATQQVKNNLFVNLDYGIYSNSGSTSATINHNIWWADCGVGSNLTLTSTQLANKEPLFCGARESSVQKFTQRIDSGAARGNNGWNELVGAKDVECAWGGLARSTVVPSNTIVTVLEDLEVSPSTRLFLNPGVQFRFDGYDESGFGASETKIDVIVATTGRLIAHGSSGNPVKLISGDVTPAEGDWYGIDARAAAELELDYVELRHATYGVSPGVNHIATNNVTHSTFADNQVYDIYCEYYGTPTPVLSNNTLTVGSGTGIRIEGPYGSGMTISGNTITGNSSSVDGIDYGQWAGSATSTFTGNTITGFSTGDGMHLRGGNAIIKQSSFYSNLYGVHVTGGTGSIGTTTTGSGNSIVSNSYGVLVYSASCSFGPVKIRRNYIGANSSTGVFVDDTNQADLGTSGEYGYNRIESNGSASIWNSSSCGAISARGNYFNDCEYGTEVVGSVDTASRLCTPPFDPFGKGDMAVEPVPQEAPFAFHGVSPNPSRGHTTIRVAIASPVGRVRIEIFDVSGRRMKILADGSFQAGSHEIDWDGHRDDGSEVPSGLYFVRGSINDERRESARILIVR